MNGNDSERRIPLEDDMKQRRYDEKDSMSSRIFKNYPLVGEYMPSEALVNKWYKNTKEYINQRLNDHSIRYKQWVYEQVTLTVVHYAKTWNSNEEGKFTRYIVTQLGYKDEGNRIWGLLCEAIEIAFKRNDRFFIIRKGDRQFYETVMVHSFGPGNAWYSLFDLLFAFYKENLEWNYVPGDPFFGKLVQVLRRYFNNTTTEADQYYISSQRYSLKIGIRRLVQERPGYCALLFEAIIRRMHRLFQNEVPTVKKYSNFLVDRWFADKISNASVITEKNNTASRKPVELALDYGHINIRYCLINSKPTLHIPAIRLLGDEEGVAKADLFGGEKKIGSYELKIHGNELGETIQQTNIDLPTDHIGEELLCRVVISRGENVLHDTDKKLWRSLVIFSDGKEISLNKIRKEKYQAFIPNLSRLKCNNIDVTPWPNGLCEIAFHKNYFLEYAGNILAIDTAELKGIRIVKPAVFENAHFTIFGEECLLARKGTSLKVYCSTIEEARKYRVVVNEACNSLADYYDVMSGNRSVIPLSEENNRTIISVIDMDAGVVVFRGSYYVIPDFGYTFNRKVYVTKEEYDNLSVTVCCNGQSFEVKASDKEEIQVEYAEGTIILDIPGIRYEFVGITTLFFEKYLRVEDISNNSELKINNRSGLTYSVLFGGVELKNPQEVMLSKYIADEQDDINITLRVDGEDYLVCKVLFRNVFVQTPTVAFKDNCLLWDGGISYVGDVGAELVLVLSQHDEERYSFGLVLGKQCISVFKKDGFVDGYYDWDIYANGILTVSGNGFIGNESKARFAGKIIHINRVTDDVDGVSETTVVKDVYIDQIRYIDTCYVETEDDIYDVYTGCMYWTNKFGEYRYFSFKYNAERSKYKVNPVKIIYISDRYLRIVNEDDEGIYYYYNSGSYCPGNEITDIEPAKKIRGYHDILFYLYDVITLSGLLQTAETKKNDNSEKRTGTITIEQQEKTKKIIPLNTSLRTLLDVPQSKVIQAAVDCRILVNAGPGTGKTWTLIERIIYLVREGIDPDNIQVLCFSRAAVEVVRSRMAEAIISGRVDVTINRVDIRTFDSFASQLLYWVKDSDYTEIRKDFSVESLNYEERIAQFVKILKLQPALIEQCEHLIVDEVQDLVLNRAEMVLNMIKCLPATSGITLFGDACQAIYDYQADNGMSSVDFYQSIKNMNQFTYYSFTHNYRQKSQLQDYCEEYRKQILSGDMEACNQELARICDNLPEYGIRNIKQFEEDSLDILFDSGKIGILTRSNAQALVISGLFHQKNIPHTLQRRLGDNSLHGWIALMFNQIPLTSYDETDFINSLSGLVPQLRDQLDLEDLWNALTSFRTSTTGRISVSELLRGIKRYGKHRGLLTDVPEEKITVSTIHRSKGREYDTVIILNSLISEKTDSLEEQRVNYVALSRAKQHMYQVELPDVYFRTLNNRRCYSVQKSFFSGKLFLQFFEVGRRDDFERYSFCIFDGVQEYIRQHMDLLRGKEVYLQKVEVSNGYVTYDLVLKENDRHLGRTSKWFAEDLNDAIRQIKKLPWHATLHDYLYPKRFSGIYILDVASEISMVQGNEKGIREFENLVTWNTILVEGYAKAEY